MVANRNTRGRTRAGRLAALDCYITKRIPEVLGKSPEAPLFIDVGFGDEPVTTLESAETFRKLNPALHVLGVDESAARVALACRHQDERTRFLTGSFRLPVPGQGAQLIRAMNVLRAYSPAEADLAHCELSDALKPGGLLLEGSCSPEGEILTTHLLRKADDGRLAREALLFYSRFDRGFSPIQFRDWLPKDLRHHVRLGQPIFEFFELWRHCWSSTREGKSPQEAFHASARALSALGQQVESFQLSGPGAYLQWQPSGGIPKRVSE